MKQSFADILKDFSSEQSKKMSRKVPEWDSVEGLSFPTTLSTEQCSSSLTARYKASLAGKISGNGLYVADLTGGLGVDSWAFSSVAEKVLHNEMNRELSEAAESNFSKMGIENITSSCLEITDSNVCGLLEDFFGLAPISKRLVFMDPARRSAKGAKVFRLEDCSPNARELVPEILKVTPHILIKLSPMADISQIARELGHCREIHVIGASGECKELLVLIDGEYDGEYEIIVTEGEEAALKFYPDEEKDAIAEFVSKEETLEGKFLFEPSKALSKAGAFKLLSSKFGLKKLGVSTHLYISGEPIEKIPGKWFRITKVASFDKASIKAIGKEYPCCEVSARNVPMTSDELRKRLGVHSGDPIHIFGTRCDSIGSNIILITEKII